MLKHIVGLNLKYEQGDKRIEEFFETAQKALAHIPQVKSYAHYKQTFKECPYDYGFILEFENEAALQEYFKNESHINFGDTLWAQAVSDFMDLNFEEL